MLNELLKLGFHDTLVESLIFDFQNKALRIELSVIVNINSNGSPTYRKGVLDFGSVENLNFTDDYDFINCQDLVLLSGEINETSCNLFLSSNQRLIIECETVTFNWK